ncbi:MAG: alpha/beta hydrolase [Clostridia bacterium]|nr:alpha/beta hydrolase [Clostridia bacterium]
MKISTKILRKELEFTKPFMERLDIPTSRLGQDKMGEIMLKTHKKGLTITDDPGEHFRACLIHNRKARKGLIMYLHGGGYVAGSLDYARGFGSVISGKFDIDVYAVGYRLAPEYPYPSALDDVEAAYERLLGRGYDPKRMIICGESAGGGLCYCLMNRLKDKGRPLPSGIVAISPWVDLTQSGTSYILNRDKDPTLSKERLDYYASQYADEDTRRNDRCVSPALFEMKDMPPSLIFSGGDEVMADDARILDMRLRDGGNRSELYIREGMWHAYLLYGMKETREDYRKMGSFINELIR